MPLRRRYGAGTVLTYFLALVACQRFYSRVSCISQWDGIHWSATLHFGERLERAVWSSLLGLSFAGDRFSSTDLQSDKKATNTEQDIRRAHPP